MKRIYYVYYIALGTLSHGMWAEPDWKASLSRFARTRAIERTQRTGPVNAIAHQYSTERIERYGELIWFDNAEATVLLCHGFLCCEQDISCFRNLFPWGRFNFFII